MLLNEIPWMNPLNVRLPNGVTRTFSSVYEASDFLENEWPLRKGQRYERAVRTCRGALNRTTPAAVAREAFIAACLEAGMPTVMADQRTHKKAGEPRAGEPKTALRS